MSDDEPEQKIPIQTKKKQKKEIKKSTKAAPKSGLTAEERALQLLEKGLDF
jgi:hypothetical protein